MKRSFTLIEILVVVTIIILLTATAAVSYSSFLKQSRDAKRKADVEQIRAALEMYRSNTNTYVITADLAPLVAGSYIQTIPTPPKSGAYTYAPSSCAGGVCSSYTLTATLENGDIYAAGPYGADVLPTPTPTTIPIP